MPFKTVSIGNFLRPDNITDGFFTLVNSVMKTLHFWIHFDSFDTHQLNSFTKVLVLTFIVSDKSVLEMTEVVFRFGFDQLSGAGLCSHENLTMEVNFLIRGHTTPGEHNMFLNI